MQEGALQYLFALRCGVERTDYFLYICREKPQFSFDTPHSWETIRYMMHEMNSRSEAFVGMTAHHLHTWYRANQFCGCCGAPMVHDEKERMMRCPGCGNMVYPRIAPAVLAAVFHGDRLLVTKYAQGDRNYALVAGFVEIGETAEQCVKREVFEETGLRVKNIRYYDSQPWGFAGNLMLAYTAELDGEDETIRRDASELAVAEFVAPEELTDISDFNSLTREMIRRFKERRLSSESMNIL
jgi:NAD+ diphosphatase